MFLIYTARHVQETTPDDPEKMMCMADIKKNEQVDIESLVAGADALVIKGSAGCGKTTILKYIDYTTIKSGNSQGLSGYLPVLLFLRDVKTIVSPDSDRLTSAGYAENIFDAYFRVTGCGLSVDVVKAFYSR